MPNVLVIERETDAKIVDALKKLGAEVGLPAPILSVMPIGTTTNLNINNDNDRSKIEEILNLNQSVLGRIEANFNNNRVSVVVDRNWDGTGLPPTCDRISMSSNDEPVKGTQFYAKLRKTFRTVDKAGFLDFLKESDAKYFQTRAAEFGELTKTTDEFFKKLLDFQTKQEERLAKKVKENDEALAAEKTRLQNEHDERMRKLQRQTQDLVLREQNFNFQEAKLVRRKQFEDFWEKILNRRKPEEANSDMDKRRRHVLIGYAGMLIVLALVACGAFDRLSVFISPDPTKTEQNYWVWVARQIAVVGGFIATTGFLISWLNDWFHSYAKQQERWLQFADDFQRANWFVEVTAEWEKNHPAMEGGKQNEMPELIVDRLTRNLFLTPNEEAAKPNTTAVDAMIKALKNKKVKVGDVEVSSK